MQDILPDVDTKYQRKDKIRNEEREKGREREEREEREERKSLGGNHGALGVLSVTRNTPPR